MSDKPVRRVYQNREAKAAETSANAAAILEAERQASDSKVARLKAARLKREAENPPEAPKTRKAKGRA